MFSVTSDLKFLRRLAKLNIRISLLLNRAWPNNVYDCQMFTSTIAILIIFLSRSFHISYCSSNCSIYKIQYVMKERRMIYLLQQAFNKLQLQLCWLHTAVTVVLIHLYQMSAKECMCVYFKTIKPIINISLIYVKKTHNLYY